MKRLLLLVLLTACSRPATVPRPALSDIPSSVPSQLGPVPVVWVDSMTNGEGQKVLGGFHIIRRTIYLQNDLKQNPTLALAVFFHETCHVWIMDSGLYNLLPEKVQQAICDAQASYRVAELQQGRR